MKKYGWVAAGVVLVIAALLGLRRSGDDSAAQVLPETKRPSPIERELPRPPLKIVKEAESVRTRLADEPKTGPSESYNNVPGTNWAVVAAIYRDYDAAARRAAAFEDVGGIRPSVFPAKGQGRKYMVLVGSGLTRAKAEELRARASAAGLPPDTYVTQLTE